MQERHPIDDRIRRVLSNAEAEPPASVWAGVAAAQDKKKKAAGWVWSMYAGIALVGVILVGGITHYLTNGDADDRRADAVVTSNDPQDVRGVNARTSARGEGTENANAPSEGAQVDTIRNSDGKASGIHVATVQPMTGSRVNSSSPSATRHATQANANLSGSDNTRIRTPVATDQTHVNSSLKPDGSLVVEDGDTPSGREHLDLLSPIFSRALILRPAPVDQPMNYLLPRGEWWLGAQWAMYSASSSWRGADEVLAAALDQHEGTVGTTALGLLGGRQWRDGFGVSTGVIVERMERSFRQIDILMNTTEEINSYFVTLNNQVFVSNVDTIRTTTMDERITEGVDRRTMLRIPVLGHWSKDLRRWSLGVHAGMALELTQAQAGPGLLRVENGTVGVGYLDADMRSDRYPDMLLALVGIDLGYRLHERWSLQAGYAGMRGVNALSEQGSVQAYPIRHGAELRLILHLPTRPRP